MYIFRTAHFPVLIFQTFVHRKSSFFHFPMYKTEISRYFPATNCFSSTVSRLFVHRNFKFYSPLCTFPGLKNFPAPHFGFPYIENHNFPKFLCPFKSSNNFLYMAAYNYHRTRPMSPDYSFSTHLMCNSSSCESFRSLRSLPSFASETRNFYSSTS